MLHVGLFTILERPEHRLQGYAVASEVLYSLLEGYCSNSKRTVLWLLLYMVEELPVSTNGVWCSEFYFSLWEWQRHHTRNYEHWCFWQLSLLPQKPAPGTVCAKNIEQLQRISGVSVKCHLNCPEVSWAFQMSSST